MTIPTALSLRPLRAATLANLPFLRHGITRRVPGLGSADGNISYSNPRDPDDAWRMRQLWGMSIGIDATTLVTAHQIHGAAVRVVNASEAGTGSAPGSRVLDRADALVSGDHGVSLMMTHADCLPILLCEPQSRVVGVVHAGWRGTIENITGAAVKVMIDEYNCAPNEILAFLGPAICKRCYAVGDEVIDQWQAAAGAAGAVALLQVDSATHFDIEAANFLQLRMAGVADDAIERSGICTCCGGPDWFSHRGQGPNTGRFGAMIAIAS